MRESDVSMDDLDAILGRPGSRQTFDSISPLEGEPNQNKSDDDPGRIPWRRVPLSKVSPPGPVDWLWEGRIAKGCITVLVGQPKSGKSTITGVLTHNLTHGTGFASRPLEGPIIVVGEEQDADWRDRCEHYGINPDLLHYIQRDVDGPESPASWAAFLRWLDGEVIESGCELVVFDTVSYCWPTRDENSNDDVRNALAPIKGLVRRTGCSVLLVHHPTKDGTRARGASAFEGIVEIILEFGRMDGASLADTRRVVNARGRKRGIPPSVVYDFVDGRDYVVLGDRRDVKAEELTDSISQILREHDAHFGVMDVVKRLSDKPSRPKVDAALKAGLGRRLWQCKDHAPRNGGARYYRLGLDFGRLEAAPDLDAPDPTLI